MLCVALHEKKYLYQPRNDGPPAPDLVLAKFLGVPPPPVDGAGQHGEDLVEEEGAGGGAGPAAGGPEAEPLGPLAEVVRVEDEAEEAGLGDAVVLVDGAAAAAPVDAGLVAEGVLPAAFAAADVAEGLVVVEVSGQAGEEEGYAEEELRRGWGWGC